MWFFALALSFNPIEHPEYKVDNPHFRPLVYIHRQCQPVNEGLETSDPQFGALPTPGVQCRETLRTTDKILGHAEYSHDAFGRRNNPYAVKRAEDFIALGGCSFTYGNLLSDNETLAYQLNTHLPQSHVYNYGVRGGGPTTVLARLEDPRFKAAIPERNGTFIYMAIMDHISRVAGSALSLFYQKDLPFYEINDSGTGVRRRGIYKTAQPWRTEILQFLENAFHIGRWVGRNYPPFTNSDFKKTCLTIVQMKKQFLFHYPKGRFVTAIHPLGEGFYGEVQECLLEKGIEVWEFPTSENLEKYLIPIDRHPSAEGNKWFAGLLAQRLNRTHLP